MSDPQFIVNNKKVLQAHVDGAILGQSATQMYTYEVFLWRIPIMLTTNNWDLSHLSKEDLDWIQSNCVVVHVKDKVFEVPKRQASTDSAPQRRRSAAMLTPEPSPPHKRQGTSPTCPACGDPLPCSCVIERFPNFP